MSTTATTDGDAISKRVALLLEDSRRELAVYGIVDSPREDSFNKIVELAAKMSGWPVAMISFFDGRRQWYKAAYGIEISEDDAASSFCLNIIAHGHEHLLVADARNDERFRDNPYVTGEPYLRGYCGIPIRSKDSDITIGTLALTTPAAGTLPQETVNMLKLLAGQVENVLELRREDRRRRHAEERLATANRQLEGFAQAIAHDLRAPLRHQTSYAQTVESEYAGQLDETGREIVRRLSRSATAADELVQELLAYARLANAAGGARETFGARSFLDEVCELAHLPDGFTCETDTDLVVVQAPRAALRHILLNLVTNAVKHHDGDGGHLRVNLRLKGTAYELTVTDDGPGIPANELGHLYTGARLSRASERRDGAIGTMGLGSYIVSELTSSLGGTVHVLRNDQLSDRERDERGIALARGTTIVVKWPVV